jgi:DNA polymerase III epsilon subunit-like protein
VKHLALDFEGSSKEPRRGCPVQLGIAVMEDGNVLDSDEWMIRPPLHYKTGKPTREVDAYSLRISGLSLERIEAEGLTSRESCARLHTFIKKNSAISLQTVAYNFTYDAECYGQMLYDGGEFDRSVYEYLAYPDALGPKWTCAYRMARLMLADHLLKFSLDDVAGYFNLARSGETHGALEDAILAGKVFHLLCNMAAQRKGAA